MTARPAYHIRRHHFILSAPLETRHEPPTRARNLAPKAGRQPRRLWRIFLSALPRALMGAALMVWFLEGAL